jgi:chromosome segregation ATPase
MKTIEAVEILSYHQRWRTGGEEDQTDPVLLTKSIDTVLSYIAHLESRLSSEKQRVSDLITETLNKNVQLSEAKKDIENVKLERDDFRRSSKVSFEKLDELREALKSLLELYDPNRIQDHQVVQKCRKLIGEDD